MTPLPLLARILRDAADRAEAGTLEGAAVLIVANGLARPCIWYPGDTARPTFDAGIRAMASVAAQGNRIRETKCS